MMWCRSWSGLPCCSSRCNDVVSKLVWYLVYPVVVLAAMMCCQSWSGLPCCSWQVQDAGGERVSRSGQEQQSECSCQDHQNWVVVINTISIHYQSTAHQLTVISARLFLAAVPKPCCCPVHFPCPPYYL